MTMPQTLARLGTLLPIVIAAACSSDIQLDGQYLTTGSWDLSAPFGRDGIGGAFADLLIETSVGTAVPGFLEDDAIELTSGLVRGPIKAAVESRLPDELKEGGPVLTGIRDVLGEIDVETRIDFADDEGRETLSKLAFVFGSRTLELNSQSLPAGISVGGTIELDHEERDEVMFDAYNLEIRFGDFILIVVDRLLGYDSSSLTSQTQSSIPCDAVVDAMTGGDGEFDFEVAGQSFALSASDLSSACNTVKAGLAQYALGMARLDSGLELEGLVTLVDDDLDGVADGFASGEGYEGRITLLPGPFEPKFAPVFTGARR